MINWLINRIHVIYFIYSLVIPKYTNKMFMGLHDTHQKKTTRLPLSTKSLIHWLHFGITRLHKITYKCLYCKGKIHFVWNWMDASVYCIIFVSKLSLKFLKCKLGWDIFSNRRPLLVKISYAFIWASVRMYFSATPEFIKVWKKFKMKTWRHV